MPFTPLHAALGEVDPALDFALLQRACQEGVEESTQLDWKQALPLTVTEPPAAKQSQQAELAKDVAALANSGGGMLVYGIREAGGGSSAAVDISPVGLVDDSVTTPIRQAAGSLIYPPVRGLEVLPVAPDDDAPGGCLVVLVPDSPDVPHLVHPKKSQGEWFSCPYRNGAHTEFMRERQLASAYAQREVGRRRRAEDFEATYQEFIDSLTPASSLRWVVAVAVPESRLPSRSLLDPQVAGDIIDRAWATDLTRMALGPARLTEQEATRRGLRRVVRTGKRTIGSNMSATMRARVEVHADGTVAVAFTRDGFLGNDEGFAPSQVPVVDLESTAKDMLALLWQTRRALRVTGDYQMRLNVVPATEIFRRSDPGLRGLFAPWDEQRIYGYRPVDGLVLTSLGLRESVLSWNQVVVDAVHQTGTGCGVDVDAVAASLSRA